MCRGIKLFHPPPHPPIIVSAVLSRKIQFYSCISWGTRFSVHSTEANEKFHLIKEKKSWTEAQRYCTENHIDLSSESQEMDWKELRPGKNKPRWIGLFRKAWLTYPDTDKNKCTKLNKGGELVPDCCEETMPFICYDGEIYKDVSYRSSTGVSQKNPAELTVFFIYLCMYVEFLSVANIFIPERISHLDHVRIFFREEKL